MADLLIRFRDAAGQPLSDEVQVSVRDASAGHEVAVARNVDGTRTFGVQVLPGRTYTVNVKPTRYRAGSQQVPVPVHQAGSADLFFPLHPKFVTATFPEYADLPDVLRQVLDKSRLAGGSLSGRDLYEGLGEVQRAGMLNLFCKMHACAFADTRSVWSFVTGLYRIEPDRIYADIDAALPGQVRATIAAAQFREVNGALHTPPADFRGAGSFKTGERFGNLQLSFFAGTAMPTTHKVDADIDDAAGLVRHTFQVLRNRFRNRTTHPYDIHQVLVRQDFDPKYSLA